MRRKAYHPVDPLSLPLTVDKRLYSKQVWLVEYRGKLIKFDTVIRKAAGTKYGYAIRFLIGELAPVLRKEKTINGAERHVIEVGLGWLSENVSPVFSTSLFLAGIKGVKARPYF